MTGTAEEGTSADEDAIRRVLDGARDASLVVQDSWIVYANAALVEMAGRELLGTHAIDLVHPEDRDLVALRLLNMFEPGARLPRLEVRALEGGGGVRWVEVIGVPFAWRGAPAVQVVVIDVEERRRSQALLEAAQHDLAESADRFRTVIDSLAEGVLVLAPGGEIATWNQAALDLLDLQHEELAAGGAGVAFNLVDQDGAVIDIGDLGIAAARAHASAVDRPEGVLGKVVGYHRFGYSRRWLSMSLRHLPAPAVDGDGAAWGGCVLSFADVTAIREAATRLSDLARYDQLTGLANRRLCLERLVEATAELRRSSDRTARPSVAVMFLDLDHFKAVNDSLGHAAGDELLVTIAQRLRSTVRPTDLVARFGGDEFVLVAEPVDGVEGAERLAERIAEAVRPPVILGSHSVSVGASIGIALAGPDEDPEALLAQADTALYRAKERGRGRHELFDEGMRVRALRKLSLEQDLRRAIADRALDVVFHPVIDLADGSVSQVEALVRWLHPELGALPADEFVGLAEDTGLSSALDGAVLAEALRAASTWRAAGLSVPVAVNLSGRQLDPVNTVAQIREALDAAGLPPAALVVEVTEQVLTEPKGAAEATLVALHELGVRVALDDFGVGASSLAALRSLPVDAVKLDRRFQEGIVEDPSPRAVLAAMCQLAHALGLAIVAEGVEDAAHLAVLESLGCDQAQGYHLATPMHVDEVVPFIRGRAPGQAPPPAAQAPPPAAQAPPPST